MKRIARIAWMLGATAMGTAVLLGSAPFESAQRTLDRLFAAGPDWAQVRHLLTDPTIQEISHGENPLPGLASLAAHWAARPRAPKVVFIGNSQMFAVSLAPGESSPAAAERTYTDLVAEHYRRESATQALCYRFAAPGMSYTETLWYVNYLALVPHLRPDVVVIQLNYQSLWNAGIREGMLRMLETPEFAAAVSIVAGQGQPYSEDFADALDRYTRQRQATDRPRHEPPQLSGPVLANRLESTLRAHLRNAPGWRERARHKSSLVDALYAARIYLLRIQPTTTRSISGARRHRSESALRAVLDTCAGRGIRTVLFSAPVNPRVSLYRTPSDRQRYQSFVGELMTDHDVQFYDLEHAIPADYWGTWMNGPDPLHLGRAAHQQMAAIMQKALEPDLRAK